MLYHIERGPWNHDNLEFMTTQDLTWYIIEQFVVAQVACVHAQYAHHLSEGDDIEQLISDEIEQIMTQARDVVGAPFIEGAPVHVMLRSTMYQCEPEHLEDAVSHDLQQRAESALELLDKIDYAVMDTFIKKHIKKDTVVYWGLDVNDLEDTDNEPQLLIGDM